MAKRAEFSESEGRFKLADRLTTLLTAKKAFQPKESGHRGPMEYKPKKPVTVRHCLDNESPDGVAATKCVQWNEGFRFIDLFAGIGGMHE